MKRARAITQNVSPVRRRFDGDRNIIVVNSGHRDFVFATRNRALQLRYLVRLYVKELVLKDLREHRQISCSSE
jgi:hypothetical protein